MRAAVGAVDWRPGCRLHGQRCRTPWGYDEAHTDQTEPYTLDQLAARTGCPHRYAYPTVADYEQGWALWRAIRRDDRPTTAEADVAFALRVRWVAERAAAETGADPDELVATWGLA